MSKPIIDIDDFKLVNVPRKIAVCPYCNKSLYISGIDGWSTFDDGHIEPDTLGLECNGEPSLRSKNWDGWMRQHSEMPYVYWLPVSETVKQWLIDSFTIIESKPTP